MGMLAAADVPRGGGGGPRAGGGAGGRGGGGGGRARTSATMVTRNHGTAWETWSRGTVVQDEERADNILRPWAG